MSDFFNQNKQLTWDITFLKIAQLMAEHSTCVRKQVGAVLVKDTRVVSTGFNGVPSGMQHCSQVFTPDKLSKPNFYDEHGKFSKAFEVHAEQNAIIFAGKMNTSCEGCTLYTTLSPCSDCAKLIVAAGIKRVVYFELYDRDKQGIELLKQMNITVEQIS